MTERLQDFLRALAITRGRAVFKAQHGDLEGLRDFQAEVDVLEELEADGSLRFVSEPHRESRTGHNFVDLVAVELTRYGAKRFLGGPANQGSSMAEKTSVPDSRNVFVVHGRNLDARNSLFRFLRSIGLRPMEWSQAIQLTGKGSPFIGEVLDVAFANAQAIVILMTPDDVAQLQEPFRSPNDPPYEATLTGQARPNVLFEAGMAMGRDPDRTVIVELGALRPFSDIGGRHTVRLSNDSRARHELAQRLTTAGCAVDLTGRDWHTEGEFEIQAITRSQEAQAPPAQKFIMPPEYDADDMIALITSFITKHYPGHERFTLHFEDIDREINFIPGAARLYSRRAAEDGGYTVISQGNATITLQKRPPESSVPQVRW